MSIPLASTDAKYALTTDFDSSEVRYWPLADFGAGKVAGTTTAGALWQPGTHRIGFIGGDAFVLFRADDGSPSTPFRGVKTEAPRSPARRSGRSAPMGARSCSAYRAAPD